MKIVNSYVIPELKEAIRLIDFATNLFEELPTRNSVKKAIKRAELLYNGKTSEQGIFVEEGAIIELVESQKPIPKVFELKLNVLFEDNYLAIVFKPAGIGVSGNYFRTIQNALPYNLKPSVCADAFPVPHPVHRLDTPTSGLLLVAKTKSMAIALGKMLENKTITKQYHALVIGNPNANGRVNSPIEDKEALSLYETILIKPSVHYGALALVKLSPLTGRTHQLRIHMASISCPIVGDKTYGTSVKNVLHKGLFLCATQLLFIHPVTGEKIDMEVEIPHKFTALLNRHESE